MKYTVKIKNIKHGKNFKVIHPVNVYGSEFGDNIMIGPVSYTHLTLPTTPYV